MKKQKAFTLIELMVVIAIIGVIASIILVVTKSARDRARIARGLQFSSSIYHALGAYAVGIWDFNEGSGTTATDTSGNGNDGDITGATYKCATDDTPSGKGCSLEFDGADRVTVPDDSSLDIPDTLSISFWFKPSSYVTGYAQHIIEKWSGTADANYVLYFFGTTAGGDYKKLRFYANRGGTWNPISGSYEVTLNKWYHIALSYSSSSGGQMYINGDAIGSKVASGSLATNNSNLLIGENLPNCLIDSVRIYEQALSQAQVRALYVQGARERDLVIK